MRRREFIAVLGGAAAVWLVGPQGRGLRRGREPGDRVPFRRQPDRATTRARCRPGSPPRCCDHERVSSCSIRGPGGDRDDTDRVRRRPGPGRAWTCGQPRPAGRQPDGGEFPADRVGGKAVGAVARTGAGSKRVAVLVNPANAMNTETTLRDVQSAARTMGLHIQVLNTGTSREIDAALAHLAPDPPDALFVGSGPLFTGRRVQLSPNGRHASASPQPIRGVNTPRWVG